MDYTDFIREHFADSDSDEEFIGFTERDLVKGNDNERMIFLRKVTVMGRKKLLLQPMIMLG